MSIVNKLRFESEHINVYGDDLQVFKEGLVDKEGHKVNVGKEPY